MATVAPTPAFPKGEDAWTREQANALLRLVEEMFHRRDVDALVNGFTEGYRLKKTLLALEGNVLTNLWEGTWDDARTGQGMAGRGLEVWRMRDGMIGVWDAAFNVWEQGGERRSPIM